MAKTNAERQEEYADRQRAKGRNGRVVWATAVEHDKIKKLLIEIRR